MTQTARPQKDVSPGSWMPTPLWEHINGDMPNTTSPIFSSNNPSKDTFEVALSSFAIPGPGPQTLTVQLGQGGTGDLPVLIALVQGNQTIASRIVQPTQSFANYPLTLSQQQISQITSYPDLHVCVTAGMPAVRSTSVAYGTTNNPGTVTISVPKPSGVQAGDLLIACTSNNFTPTVTPPSGWTLVDGGTSGLVYSRRAGSSEPSSYTWSAQSTASGGVFGFAVVVVAVENSTVGVVTYTYNHGTGSQATALSVSATSPSLVFAVFDGDFQTSQVQGPGSSWGMVSYNDQPTAGWVMEQYIYSQAISSGSTSSATVSFAYSGTNWAAFQVLIQ